MDVQSSNTGRCFIKRTDWLVIILFLFVSLGSWALLLWTSGSEKNKMIEIYSDNQLVQIVSLPAQDGYLEVTGKPVRLELRENQIRFYETDCPDKTCIRTGFISRIGETAICLPNRVMVKIVGSGKDGGQVDGIAG